MLIGLLLNSLTVLYAQQQELEPLPIDPALRYGQLPNGMTYYIRHNDLPKERADFYIAQNVGSILEEENQRGLAHFLEHMAFNGSKNFPEKGMDRFTESIGMRMGENLNAYTSFDETVYMLRNVPVTRQEVIDSCLLILHDWSGFLALTDSMIEKERPIIREEWRTGQDAQVRLWEQQLPKLFPDSRYGHRLPIGTIEVIDHFQPEELRAYYHTWYRPDLQAVIIVGDIDVDRTEERLKTMFADIPAPVDPAPRVTFEVPDTDIPPVSIATDKEASDLILYLFYKHDKMPREWETTLMGLVKDYIRSVSATMINERLDELTQQADPPFIYAEAGDGDYMVARTKGAWTAAAVAKEGEIESTLGALVRETERLRQYGFTASEYERARTNLLKAYETAYNERDNQRNGAYVQEYVSHFTEGGYIPGIEMEYMLLNQIAPNIPVEQVNQYVQDMIDEDNFVIALTGPDKAGITYPTEEELLIAFFRARQEPVEPYQETVSDEPLIPQLPVPGRITEVTEDPLFETTILTLENGIKVVLKQTDFKKDEVRMTATSPGGSTLFGSDETENLKVFNDVIGLGGLGNFSAIELGKKLAGKQVSCATSLGLDHESVNGSSTPADLETLFQLIYLSFTAPRADEEAYTSFETRLKAQLQNLELNPMVAFSDSLSAALYRDDLRAQRIRPEDFDKISYPRILEMYKERFADASDFVFTFIGNIDAETIVPYIAQYLATLPTLNRTEKGNEAEVPAIREGKFTNHFRMKQETPKASVAQVYAGNMPYNLENILTATLLRQILDLVYTEKIREDEGGTYGVRTSLRISSFPEGETTLQVYFDTDPPKRTALSGIVRSELRRIAQQGPREEDFRKSVDNMIKRHAENLQENAYWLNVLDNYYYRGIDSHTGYTTILQAISPEKVRTFARELLDQGNTIEVVMEP
ncbi:insulinase family protein [Parabacteroides sp. PF5-6]|uniref:M16 family metallopeptidase n=1 Tax=Parabacteroides sp. PF5-6 TaxID=1742403 RepID=UPI002405AE26|nr:insulinase family protein [Parabacteroides sp. PF5-6]